MRTSGINLCAQNFKGAYIINGKGKDVKTVREELEALQKCHPKEKMQIDNVGYGYLENEVPAYLLVTTGNDVEIYNDYVKNHHNEYRRISELEFPEYAGPNDFSDAIDYIEYFLKHEAVIDINAIQQGCRFKEDLGIFSALKILKAIKENNFDHINGKLRDK